MCGRWLVLLRIINREGLARPMAHRDGRIISKLGRVLLQNTKNRAMAKEQQDGRIDRLPLEWSDLFLSGSMWSNLTLGSGL